MAKVNGFKSKETQQKFLNRFHAERIESAKASLKEFKRKAISSDCPEDRQMYSEFAEIRQQWLNKLEAAI